MAALFFYCCGTKPRANCGESDLVWLFYIYEVIMSFFGKIKQLSFGGYAPLKAILDEEQKLGLFKGRSVVVVKHEKYFSNEVDLAVDTDDESDLY